MSSPLPPAALRSALLYKRNWVNPNRGVTSCPDCVQGNAAPLEGEDDDEGPFQATYVRCGTCGGTGEVQEQPRSALEHILTEED
jgi:hypothetical protein